MKKLLAAVMVFAGAAAYAQVDATQVGPAIKDEAKGIGHSAKENAKEWGDQAGLATENEGTFKTADAFDLKGRLKDGGRGEITVLRDRLPPAVLDIRKDTQIFVDGKKCNPSDLKAGMDVKTKFQIEGNETVAVRVDAKSNAYGGSGKAGVKTDDAVKDDMKAADDKADATARKTEKKADKAAKKTDKKMDKAADDTKDAAHDATH